YILYLQPLFTDVGLLLIFMCYCSPMVVTQFSIFPLPLGKYVADILDSMQNYCWFNNCLSQISLALNRIVVTVLLRLNFFTQTRTILISILQHSLALAITVTSQYLLPCCRLEFDFTIFSYREVYITDVPNISWTHLKRPVQIACSTIPFILYTIILLSIRSIGRRIHLKSEALNRRRKQELKFTAQFATLAAIYTISWVMFSILPTIVLTSGNSWIHG
ncbi:hypothetical protein PENTCL1PPCAC_19919, partial [Pristionchus entomophagus]